MVILNNYVNEIRKKVIALPCFNRFLKMSKNIILIVENGRFQQIFFLFFIQKKL